MSSRLENRLEELTERVNERIKADPRNYPKDNLDPYIVVKETVLELMAQGVIPLSWGE